MSVPVVGVQIHEYDGPGTALRSRNTVKDDIPVKMNQLSRIYQRKGAPDGQTALERTSAVLNNTTVKSERYLEFYSGLNTIQVRALLLIKHLQ